MTAERKRELPDYVANPRGFHLIGVCGTGMGSLAVMLKRSGYAVSGSDTGFYAPMSEILQRNAIACFEGWSGRHLDALDAARDIVVVGNVCRRDNPEAVAALERGFACLSLPEVLYLFYLKDARKRVCIAGTHGKTTTSSITTAILEACGKAPSFFIGGEVLAYGTGARKGDLEYFVIEGDEYDSAYFDKVPKFWHYAPNVLCINNIEYDHADIYDSVQEIVDVFKKLVAMLPRDALIVYNSDDARVVDVLGEANCASFGFSVKNADARFYAENIEYLEGGGVSFDVYDSGAKIIRLHSPNLSGVHNVYNLLAAYAMAVCEGLEPSEISEAIRAFRGVRKRQELIADVGGVRIYDDFAHHPTAVRETVTALRRMFPERKLWAVFEIKSNTSRRAIFQADYPEALREADEIILSAPWRKDNLPPEQLISVPKIVDDLREMGCSAQLLPTVSQIVEYLSLHCAPGDIVLAMSGSSFDGLHHRLAASLQSRDEI
ncbi:MAG: UDP-N-acetylmuramate--L-alanine ligase [Bradymonadia bacterium]